MLRTLFGKKDKEENPIKMASTITFAEFKDALSRYPQVLKKISKPAKDGHLSLEELDKFRFIDAPGRYSKNTGRTIELDDLKKLVDWKIRHGTFRPTLPGLVAKNSNETIAAATKEAFANYAKNTDDVSTTINLLSKPLKGVGPSTASLLLSIHDPQNVVFFSDELYRFLVTEGKKTTIKYETKEFQELFAKAKAFMARIKCSPQDLEKVAFTLIQENEPEHVPAPKKAPSGRPRGRPAKPDSEKKAKKPLVPGRGRGRPPGVNGAAPKAKAVKAEKLAKAVDGAEPKKRGRPAAAKVEEGEPATPASKKRKEAPTSASSKQSDKKAKA